MAVYRINKGEKFLGRSYCDYCHKKLESIELIPIVSYLLFKGRCRKCHKKLPLIYPFVELISGLSGLLAFNLSLPYLTNGLDFLLSFIVVFGFCEFLLFFAVYDLQFWELDLLSLKVAIIFGLLLNILSLVRPLPFLTDPLGNFSAAVILAGIIFLVVLLTNGAGMGEGDIYLFAFVGLFVGIDGLLIAFLITVISGSVVGLVKALQLRKFKGVMIQFAPFIAFGAFITFIFKAQILQLIESFFWLP